MSSSQVTYRLTGRKAFGQFVDKVGEKVHLKHTLPKQFFAELLGTFLLVGIGDSCIASAVLSRGAAGNVVSICLGYGFALLIGILVAGGVSGAHLNPAVTLAFVIVKKSQWKQLLVFWLAQYLGAFLGAGMVYGVFTEALQEYWNGTSPGLDTASIFATYPQPFLSASGAFIDQIVGTALLLILVSAAVDRRNAKLPNELLPFAISFGLIGILMAFGFNCGAALNPARDLSPRILTIVTGWSIRDVMNPFEVSFWWIPFVACHIGGIVGALCYLLLVEVHHEAEDLDE